MTLGITIYPRINGNEVILGRAADTEIEALNIAREAIRLVRREAGTEDYYYEPAKTAAVYYNHPSLPAGRMMAAWLEESIIGHGIYLFTRPVADDAMDTVPAAAASDYRVYLHALDGRPEFRYPDYGPDGLLHISDESRLRLAQDVFGTVMRVQSAQEDCYFHVPATIN